MPRPAALVPSGKVDQLEWSRNALNKINITVFEVSDDGKKVKCTVCAPFNTLEQWMLRDSHSSHLKSRGHLANAARSPGQTFEDRVMAADSAARADAVLQDLVFARLQGVDVCTDASSSKGFQAPTAGEQEMWQNYDIDGADFEIADDPDQVAGVAARRHFENMVENFGLWNTEADGEGFGPDSSAEADGLGWNPEEDELLTEVMRNACEFVRNTATIIG